MKAECRLPAPYVRVVVDTNVIISAALSPDGVPGLLLRRLLREGQLAFSPATFAELETRLWKPKFDPYFTLEERNRYLHGYSSLAFWLANASPSRNWSRDPSDDKFIDVALRAQAVRLITGDGDLLCLDTDTMGGLRMVTPRTALDEIDATGMP